MRLVGAGMAVAAVLGSLCGGAAAQAVVSEPFLGVTHYSITQASPRPLNIQLLEIDLNHPGISFRMSPHDPGLPIFPETGVRDETIRQTTRSYVNEQSAQIGVNTSYYRLDTGSSTNNNGLLASDGHAYSPWDSTGQVGFNITEDNIAQIVTAPSNRPTGYETNPAGVPLYNAVTGSHRLLANGVNVAPPDGTGHFQLHPRTAVGMGADKLFLVTIDGRQDGFSEGMYLREVANLLADYGATEAVNLDGGGSTTMAFDYYGDGAARSQLINRTPGLAERRNGASLGIFAAVNPAYVPPTGVVSVPTAKGSIRVLDDFENAVGRFDRDPDFSGSNRGLFETTDGVGPSAAGRDANHFAHGFAAHRIDIVSQDDPAWDGFRLRHVSGGGSPVSNEQLGTTGFVGFWLKTLTAGLTASIGLDENLTTNIELGVAKAIIADGQWRLYEWNLADASQWDPFNGSANGQINGPVMTVDSIFISSLTDQDAVVWIDALSYNPNGSIAALIPEPTAAGSALLALAALGLRRRRTT